MFIIMIIYFLISNNIKYIWLIYSLRC